MKIVETFPHITDNQVVIYARGDDDKIYVWNASEGEWVLHQTATSP